MIVDYEWLLAHLLDAIKQCRKCLNNYVQIFAWYSHYGTRGISFSQFYKDVGLWKEAIVQTASTIDRDEPITDKVHAFEPIYNAGLVLYNRASNALYESEIADSSEDGGAALFMECGKLETQVKMINNVAKQLNEEKNIAPINQRNEEDY